MSLTREQRIQKANVTLLNSKEFALLSGILMCSPTEIQSGVPTAFTDGWRVVIGTEFMDSLDDKTLAWVMCHERFHILTKQMTTWKALWKKNPRLANVAADHVINLMIDECDPQGRVTRRWPDALFDEAYRGMDTLAVFKMQEKEQSESQDGSGEGSGESMDEHGWDQASEVPEQEQAARDAAIDAAIRQGQILAGKMGGNVPRGVGELLAPKVDWREQLREFVQSVANDKELSTWRLPNRRWLGQGMYMPTMYSEAVGPVVLAIDTSGSVGSDLLRRFISEFVGLCNEVKPERVYLLWWDAEVEGVHEFARGEFDGMVDVLRPTGGGGTDPSCVMRWVEENKITLDAMVVATDGFCPFPEPQTFPVLWAINTGVVAPFGVTVKLEDE